MLKQRPLTAAPNFPRPCEQCDGSPERVSTMIELETHFKADHTSLDVLVKPVSAPAVINFKSPQEIEATEEREDGEQRIENMPRGEGTTLLQC